MNWKIVFIVASSIMAAVLIIGAVTLNAESNRIDQTRRQLASLKKSVETISAEKASVASQVSKLSKDVTALVGLGGTSASAFSSFAGDVSVLRGEISQLQYITSCFEQANNSSDTWGTGSFTC